jgi:signal transduction histidine kinase/CheY-like chemotaxis protein
MYKRLINTFTLETKFKIGFSLVFICLLGILLVEISSTKLGKQLEKQYKLAKDIEYGVFSVDQLIGDYIVFESKSDAFYIQDEGKVQGKLNESYILLNNAINELSSTYTNNDSSKIIINQLSTQLIRLMDNSTNLVDIINKRGHRNFGSVGEMRDIIHEIESLLDNNHRNLYLSIRRNEKDFLLRKDLIYSQKVNALANELISKLNSENTHIYIQEKIATYLEKFNTIVKYDFLIGTYNAKGLIHFVRSDLDNILDLVNTIIEQSTDFQTAQDKYYATLKTVAYSLVTIILLIVGLLFHYRFTQPMHKLSTNMKAIMLGSRQLLPDKASYYELGNEVSEMALAMKDLLNKLEDQKDKLANVAIDAQEASRIKTEFLSTMSHEIRTPLNAVVNIISDLSESKNIKKHHDEDITILKASSEYLLSLINDVLDMNKIGEGKLRLNPKTTDFHEQLNTVCYIFNNRFKSKNIEFINEISFGDIPRWLQLDSVRLNQVLYNLLGNALKFTNSGSVRFKVSKIQEDEQSIDLHFDVEDSGIGIAKEKLSFIFDRFNQADSSNNRTHSGSGLGLSIAQSLIKLMGGHIEVESTINEGSRFYFSIRCIKADHLNSNETQNLGINTSDSIINHQSLHNILVVDDNLVNLRIAKKIIEKEGFKAHTASNGEEALKYLADNPEIDLVLMDLQMPVMDGFEAAQRIRLADAPYNEIPIIAVSASALVESQDQAYLAGMNDYVCKPFTAIDLMASIRKNMGQRNYSFTKPHTV